VESRGCPTRRVLHLTWTNYLRIFVMNTRGVCMKPGGYYPRNGPCPTLFGQCLGMRLFSTAFLRMPITASVIAGTPKAVNQMWDLSQYPLRLLLFRIQELGQTFKQSIKQH
ncbi:hypothetical protein HN873_049444, partial [Arachis hypogaea]